MILVLNCGSQSIKWKVFEPKSFKLVKEGKRIVLDKKDYEIFLEEELKKVGSLEIERVGHRVVHGGNIFLKTTQINQEAINQLEKINHLAPLHNPYNVLGIKICQKIYPNVSHFAVFDTEFFKDLPERAFNYALPESIVKEFGYRRFGFHGTSHEYVAKEAAKALRKPLNKLKMITCHLGGGSSITAINKGKAIDTSMGFTPQEGLVMMTRPGNIDTGLVLDLVKNFSLDKATETLNKESGLKGVCGNGEMLGVLDMIKKGDKRAKLALDIFVYSLQKYIGSYFAILGGCDALVFTGTIGSGSSKIRNMVIKNLDILKKTKILAIKTEEELQIAQKILK